MDFDPKWRLGFHMGWIMCFVWMSRMVEATKNGKFEPSNIWWY